MYNLWITLIDLSTMPCEPTMVNILSLQGTDTVFILLVGNMSYQKKTTVHM